MMHPKQLRIVYLHLLLDCLFGFGLANISNDKTSLDALVKVTVVEGESDSFFVATGENNYAIYCPKLAVKDWQTLSFNDLEVSVLTASNITLNKRYYKLTESTQDFIAEVKSDFVEDLPSLELFDTKSNVYKVGTGLGPDRGQNDVLAGPSGSGYINANVGPVYHTAGLTSVSPYPIVTVNPSSGYNVQNSLNGRSYAKYNHVQNVPLKKSLTGDIYEFDMLNNVLTIYSSSVSLKVDRDLSIVYRDHHYFTWGQANLPQQINRFFLYGNVVFFVYNDGTVLVKLSWLLNAVELDMIVSARAQVRELSKWQSIEIDVELDKKHSDSIEDKGKL